MEFKEIQKKSEEIVRQIDEKFDVKRDINVTMVQLLEEIGELARQPNKLNIRNEEIDKENLSEELADSLILLCSLASQENIDLEESILNKINKLKERHEI